MNGVIRHKKEQDEYLHLALYCIILQSIFHKIILHLEAIPIFKRSVSDYFSYPEQTSLHQLMSSHTQLNP